MCIITGANQELTIKLIKRMKALFELHEGRDSLLSGLKGAFYHKEIGEFLLPYDVARNAKSSDDVPLSFLQTTYEA